MENKINKLISFAIKNGGVVDEMEVKKMFSELELDNAYEALEQAGIEVEFDEEYDMIEDLSTEWDYSNTPIADTAKMYMRQIGQIPLLDYEEELELAELAASGDQSAKEKLVEHNLRLAVSVAKKYFSNSGMSFMDLVQEANIGLIKAADKFDVTKGYRFSTYATWWIRQTVGRAVQEQSRTIRIPVHLIEMSSKINKVSRELTQKLNREPSLEEIAKAANMPVDKVKFLFSTQKDTLSLDNPLGEEDNATVGDVVADESSSLPFDAIINAENKSSVIAVLDTLTKREKDVMILRFGIEDNKPKTLEEIGAHFGVTRERIRQIETKALRKLRNPIRSKMLKDILV